MEKKIEYGQCLIQSGVDILIQSIVDGYLHSIYICDRPLCV